MNAPAHPPTCDVSFAIACYNALPFLDEAIESALAQTEVAVEILVVDDGSTDGSFERAQDWARRDPRVRVFRTPENQGPAGARNLAIEAMRGSWYAVLDSDDLIAPGRSAALIAEAEAQKADMIADDLTIFGAGIADHLFLGDRLPKRGFVIDLPTYFANTIMFAKHPNFGFLKPMIRRQVLREKNIRYEPRLRIAEDDELVVRLLLAGCRYFVVPRAYYRYRKHAGSTSHRLSLNNAQRIFESEKRIGTQLQRRPDLVQAHRKRWRSVVRAVAFTRAVEALKRKSVGDALRALIGSPGALRHFAMPIAARWRRFFGRAGG